MTDRILSIEEIRRWLKGKLKATGKLSRNPGMRHGEEFAVNPFCRAVGIDYSDLYRFAAGRERYPLSPHRQRVFSRFIADWENGLLEFSTVKHRGTRRQLVHRTTPKVRPQRMVLDWQRGKLQFVARPPLNPTLPSFKDVFGNLRSKR